jgi:hypothetical protein
MNSMVCSVKVDSHIVELRFNGAVEAGFGQATDKAAVKIDARGFTILTDTSIAAVYTDVRRDHPAMPEWEQAGSELRMTFIAVYFLGRRDLLAEQAKSQAPAI